MRRFVFSGMIPPAAGILKTVMQMKERPIWKKTAELPRFAPLDGDRNVDVLVIGGGMAGLLCADCLTRAGVDCLLVEQGTICSGVTGRTTAKVTLQHGLIYDKLIRTRGAACARLYLAANETALAHYRARCAHLPGVLEERDAYVYARDRTDALERELRALERLGRPAEFVQETELPFPVAGAIRFRHQAALHPLRFAAAIASGLPICEHTRVRKLHGTRAHTDRGTVTAKHIVLATHFPLPRFRGSYALKLYQERSYVLALTGAPTLRGLYLGTDGLSLRAAEGCLLLGGGSARTGKKTGAWAQAEYAAAQYFPEAREVCRWATQDCMTLDGAPYIGRFSRFAPHWYAATGFGKWGMTWSMAAAQMLTDEILGRESPYARLLSPSRSMLRVQLARNAAEAAAGLLRLGAPRCPHLGCALRWNVHEHTWDCACHGSRFAEQGTRCNEPAQTDLKRP